MSIWNKIASLVSDPPPSHLFELSEAGIAFANGKQTSFHDFEPGTLLVSPVEDNLLRADAVASMIGRMAQGNATGKKRKPAAVILPDYCGARERARFRFVSVIAGRTEFAGAIPREENDSVRYRFRGGEPFRAAACRQARKWTWSR